MLAVTASLLATVTVSKTVVKGIAMVGSPPGEPSVKHASLVTTAATMAAGGAEHQVTPNEPSASSEAPAGQAKWQWDPKHNPLALLSDIF